LTFISFMTTISALAGRVSSAAYTIDSNIVGADFYDFFSFQAIADPTNGRVDYVDEPTAVMNNLTFASPNTFIMRADSTSVLSPSGPGRQSVRLMSNKAFNTSLLVLDISHMPEGCGTWPAFWEVGPNWPNNGEVDLIEGVNNQGPNQSTLHTAAGCTMPSSGAEQTGTTVSTDCDAFDNFNAGCGVQEPSSNSFGPNFNANGGGWYVMERTSQFIKMWFWERSDPTVPEFIVSGSPVIHSSRLGTPYANFENTQCDMSQSFGELNIIINLTFCGDLAGNAAVYGASGCPSTCNDFVNNNPSAFANAYFQIESLRIYE